MDLRRRWTALSRLRIRTIRAHSYRWQRRLIFALGGLIVGLVAVGLALCANEAQALFHQLSNRWPYAPLLITPLGFGVTAYMVRRYFPNTQGSGIPQALAAKDTENTKAEPEFSWVGRSRNLAASVQQEF